MRVGQFIRKTGRKPIQHKNIPRRPRGRAPHESTAKSPKQPKPTPKHLNATRRRRTSGAAAPTSTPAPRPRPHTSRRPSRPSDQNRHSNTSTQHGGGESPEPPLRHPRRPQGRAPPSRSHPKVAAHGKVHKISGHTRGRNVNVSWFGVTRTPEEDYRDYPCSLL